MKQYILPSILMLFGLGFIACGITTNKKPEVKQSACPYEGLECPNAHQYAKHYQIELLPDTNKIWDGDRLVSALHYSQSIDSILVLDNQ